MSPLLKNAIAMLAARLAPPVFSFAINVAVARLLGADTLGAYVYLLSLFMVFQAVASGGMSLLLTREISARPEEAAELVHQGRAIGFATGGLATAGFLAWALWAPDGATALAALALATALVPSAWIGVQEAYFVARHEHHVVTAVAVVENAIKLGLAGAVFAAGGGLVGLCAGIAAARFCALGLGQSLMARSGCQGAWGLDAHGAAPLARALPPFGGMLVLAILYFRADVLVLGALRGQAATGVYGAALAFYSVALLIPDSAMTAVYPRLAASSRAGTGGFAPASVLAAKLLAIGLTPVAVGLITIAGPLLETVYGARFAASAEPLRLLAASLPAHGVNAALGQALQACGQQRAALAMVAFGTALHVALTVALVAWLGVPGAPLAVLASSSLFVGLAAWVFHKRVARLRLGVSTAIAASAVAGPIGLALAAPPHLMPLALVAGIVWIAVAVFAERVFVRTELDEVLRVLRPQRVEAGA